MRITVNGTDLYVDVDGPQLRVAGDRLVEVPTVVVLHGGPGFDQGYLRPGLGQLSAVARMVFVDLRSQGRSGRPPVATCTLEQMADDVAALCDRLGIVAPTVFGHSAGGFVALHLALRHPATVSRLILCSTSPTLAPLTDPDPPPGPAQRTSPEAVAVAGKLFGGDFSAATVEAFNRLVAPAYAGPKHMHVPEKLFALSRFEPAVAGHFFPALAAEYDVRDRLPEIAVPTLVVVGREDWVCPPVASRILASSVPSAQLAEIADAGHFPFSEEPTAFGSAVTGFLDRTGQVPAGSMRKTG